MPTADAITNAHVADRLREAADLLAQQGANPYRVGAYRRAAETVSRLDRGLEELLESGGVEGLVALPGIGQGIAGAIRELLTTGRWGQLERLRGASGPEEIFQGVPGLGPRLARRLHEALHVETLEGLEAAAFDGRLETVRGIGPRRAAALRATLERMLGRRTPRTRPEVEGPPVALLLDVDREYRERAAAEELPTIAPRRLNPAGEAWLPILHTQRENWHFTALFSNTARAHELGTTRDWVVLYFHQGDGEEGQHTVVTETRGPLVGRRVVRGRERECRSHYEAARTP
ncbi:MAG: helix-hairpin-helix domain-containing protein [Deferrisomatales bacterium]|nr:helix-hairpin-helix domain-containing protein [Deferrisomatales bacterium]